MGQHYCVFWLCVRVFAIFLSHWFVDVIGVVILLSELLSPTIFCRVHVVSVATKVARVPQARTASMAQLGELVRLEYKGRGWVLTDSPSQLDLKNVCLWLLVLLSVSQCEEGHFWDACRTTLFILSTFTLKFLLSLSIYSVGFSRNSNCWDSVIFYQWFVVNVLYTIIFCWYRSLKDILQKLSPHNVCPVE